MQKEAVLSSVEKTLDVIEDQLDTIERVRPGHFNLNGTTKKQQITILGVTAAIGVVAGGGLTYALLHNRLKNKFRLKYEALAEEEIRQAKEFYGKLHKTTEEYSSPEQVLESLHGAQEAADALRAYQGKHETPVAPEEDLGGSESTEDAVAEAQARVEIIKNVFANSSPVEEDDWDYGVELAFRAENPNAPYIISHDEYFEAEKDYEQASLTYFEGDDVLSDDREMPVEDVEGTVGEDNLTRFGYGSKDQNILYVRNDHKELDFEIQRSPGRYAEEVLGFVDETTSLKHSHKPGRKFRERDE